MWAKNSFRKIKLKIWSNFSQKIKLTNFSNNELKHYLRRNLDQSKKLKAMLLE